VAIENGDKEVEEGPTALNWRKGRRDEGAGYFALLR
jgi:hypothetical protein